MIDFETILAQVTVKALIEKAVKTIDLIFSKESKRIDQKVKANLKKVEYEFFKENYDLEISEKGAITVERTTSGAWPSH